MEDQNNDLMKASVLYMQHHRMVVKVLLANGATIEKKTIDVAKNEDNTEVLEDIFTRMIQRIYTNLWVKVKEKTKNPRKGNLGKIKENLENKYIFIL